jgi:hypothetical protein
MLRARGWQLFHALFKRGCRRGQRLYTNRARGMGTQGNEVILGKFTCGARRKMFDADRRMAEVVGCFKEAKRSHHAEAEACAV